MDDIRVKLEMALKQRPLGVINISDLPRWYKSFHKEKLDFQNLGFDELKDLLEEMSDVFHVSYDNKISDYRVFLVNYDVREALEKERSNMSSASPRFPGERRRSKSESSVADMMKEKTVNREKPIPVRFRDEDHWELYVNNFPTDWKERDLKKVFETFNCTRVRIRNKEDQVFGFATFKEYADAEAACTTLDGKCFDGIRLSIQFVRTRRASEDLSKSRTEKTQFSADVKGSQSVFGKRPDRFEVVDSSDLMPSQKSNSVVDEPTVACADVVLKGVSYLSCCERMPDSMRSDELQRMIADIKLEVGYLPYEDLPEKLEIVVIHVCDSNHFWGTVANSEKLFDDFRDMLKMMSDFDESSKPEFQLDRATEREKGVGVVYEGQDLCRVWIKSRVDSTHVDVFYIDYGNSERRSTEELFVLPRKWWLFQPLALPFHLTGTVENGWLESYTNKKMWFRLMSPQPENIGFVLALEPADEDPCDQEASTEVVVPI